MSLLNAPRPILAASALIAVSLLGDSAIYVILPVAYAQRGLTPFGVGILLSTNRWVRLFTNVPAARLLGTYPIRTVFFTALAIGNACSLVYAATTSFVLLLIARAAWGSSWSIIRLTGLMTLTDSCEAGLAAESSLGLRRPCGLALRPLELRPLSAPPSAFDSAAAPLRHRSAPSPRGLGRLHARPAASPKEFLEFLKGHRPHTGHSPAFSSLFSRDETRAAPSLS